MSYCLEINGCISCPFIKEDINKETNCWSAWCYAHDEPEEIEMVLSHTVHESCPLKNGILSINVKLSEQKNKC